MNSFQTFVMQKTIDTFNHGQPTIIEKAYNNKGIQTISA